MKSGAFFFCGTGVGFLFSIGDSVDVHPGEPNLTDIYYTPGTHSNVQVP